jgi:hypothetical protein
MDPNKLFGILAYFWLVLVAASGVRASIICPKYKCGDLSHNKFTYNKEHNLVFCFYSSASNPMNIFIDDEVCFQEIMDERHYCALVEFDEGSIAKMNSDQLNEMKYPKAICKGVSDFEEPVSEIRLPGEECDIEQHLYICAFGKRLCHNGR